MDMLICMQTHNHKGAHIGANVQSQVFSFYLCVSLDIIADSLLGVLHQEQSEIYRKSKTCLTELCNIIIIII